MIPSDTQLTEIKGLNWLMVELLKNGIEIAKPMRDRGVDLVAYDERGENLFCARPIQLKVSSKESFSIDKKYGKSKGLLFVYVWNIDFEPIAYAWTFEEAKSVAEKMGYLKTDSWAKGTYVVTKVSKDLKKLLEPYKMSAKQWNGRMFGTQSE